MYAVGNLRARPISLALVAGLVAFEAVLLLGTGAIGIPGLLLVRFTGESSTAATRSAEASEGGESVVVKLASAEPPNQLSLQAASSLPPAAPETGEPRLDGLAEIPLKPWVPEDPKPDDADEAKPEEQKTVIASSAGKEVLPWDEVEPVPFSPEASASRPADATAAIPNSETPRPRAAAFKLPASGAVEGWVKGKATEIKGEDRGRALYHFEYWLDAPDDVKHRLVAVAYDFNTPAVRPQSQISNEEKTGFRVSAGGLTCADKVTVTLKFNDGQSQQVAVDGCRLVS